MKERKQPTKEQINAAMAVLRSIRTEKRRLASQANAKLGGKPPNFEGDVRLVGRHFVGITSRDVDLLKKRFPELNIERELNQIAVWIKTKGWQPSRAYDLKRCIGRRLWIAWRKRVGNQGAAKARKATKG